MKNLIFLLLIPFVCLGQEDIERYKLYSTDNIYTSLKLDTSNGKLWQIQIGIGDVVESVVVLSDWKYAKTVAEVTEEYNEDFKFWTEKIKNDTLLSPADIERYKPSLNEDLSHNSLAKNGRFKLYPTKNIYNFILLDVINGRTWQVQWNIEEKKRIVKAIF